MGSSGLCTFGIIWTCFKGIPKVSRIILSKPGMTAGRAIAKQGSGMTAHSCEEIDRIVDQIVGAMEGENILFNLDIARLDLCSPFQQRVLQAVHRVQRGCVTTYHRISKYLGNPSAARAAGNALANNPFPIIIPCHRVIRSDRTPGGYQGGSAMKKILLEYEGVEFNIRMQVINPKWID